MLTKNDKTFLQQAFATKSEIASLKSEIANVLDVKLKPVHKKLDAMQKSLDITNRYFDMVTTKHTKQIKRIEEHLVLPPFPDFA